MAATIPLKLWEATRLDEQQNDENLNLVMGIGFAEDGRPAFYRLREDVGGLALFSSMDGGRYVDVPAGATIHVYSKCFSEQLRGVPMLATCGTRLDNLNEYTKAELEASTLATRKQLFVRENEQGQAIGEVYEDDDGPILDRDQQEIMRLANGADLVNWAPDHPTTAFADFADKQIQSVAAGAGTTAFDLSQDYSSINFSAGRLAALTVRDNYRAIQKLVVGKLYARVFREFAYQASLSGAFGALPPTALIEAARFTPRAYEHVQPREQMMANVEGIKAGVRTMREVVEGEGKDWDEHVRQLEEEAELRQGYRVRARGESVAQVEVVNGDA